MLRFITSKSKSSLLNETIVVKFVVCIVRSLTIVSKVCSLHCMFMLNEIPPDMWLHEFRREVNELINYKGFLVFQIKLNWKFTFGTYIQQN